MRKHAKRELSKIIEGIVCRVRLNLFFIKLFNPYPDNRYFCRCWMINEFLMDQHILNLSVLRTGLPVLITVPKTDTANDFFEKSVM